MNLTKRLTCLLHLLSLIGCHSPVSSSKNEGLELTIDSMSYAKCFGITKASDSSVFIQVFNQNDNHLDKLQQVNWQSHEIEKIGCLSTTHLPFIFALDASSKIVATGFHSCIHFPELERRIKTNSISYLAETGNLDKELLLKSAPELFFTYPFGGNTCQDMLNAGIGCVQVTEYLEEHPLGRAEWIKLFGTLLNRSEKADSIFKKIEQRYKDASTISHQNVPLVFFGTFDGEAYYAPPGNSFIAQLIRDAGAQYCFEDKKGSSNIRLDKEQMMEITSKVDFIGSVEFGKNEWANNIQSISSGKTPVIFRCDAAQKDYYGKALLEPDALLRDFNLIFHGRGIPTDSLKYFELCE